MKQLSKIALFVYSRRKYALTRITCGVVAGYIGMLGADRAFAAGPIPATTLPGGGNVVAGSATLNANGSVLNINQTTDRAIVNWDTFSVGSGASVNFNQPNVTSSTLNRVISSNPSEIYGSITSKGSVFFINPNGILFGQGSSVNAPAAVASTLNMRDADFMAGNTSFSGNSQTAITNLGRFNVTRGGSVVFIGNNISNVGSISAPGGTVGLVAGDTVSVNIGTPGATQPFTVNGGTAISRQISNSGTINADGGTVHLQAAALDAAATTGQYADVMHSGAITAGGGTVKLLGQRVGVLAGSTIDTSGDASGGTVLIGGNYLGSGPEQNAEAVYMDAASSIKANAITNGNGGKVILWSDKYTEANGAIEAKGGALGGNGGFVETSSHGVLNANASVNTLANNGGAGTWLLDPNDITITSTNTNISAGPTFTPTGGGSTSSTVAAATIVAALASSNVTVSTVSAGTGLGNIVVSSPIAYTGGTARTLSLIASRNVTINAGISSTAAPLSVLVNSNTSGTGGHINLNGAISSFGGNVTLAGGTAGDGSGFALGNGELPSTAFTGIYFNTGASITAAGGNVVVRGQAGGSGASNTFNSGIELGAGSTTNTFISTTGAGNITLVGVGGTSTAAGLMFGAMAHGLVHAQSTPIVPNIPNLPQQPNTPSPAGDALRALPQFDNLKDKSLETEINNDFPVKINQGATGDVSKFPALIRLTKFESDLDQDILGYNLVSQYFTKIINRSEWERISNEIWEGYRQNGRLVRVDLLFERDETIVSVTQLRNRKVEVFTDGVIDAERQDLVLNLARTALPDGAPVDLKALDIFLRKLEFQAKETVETELNSADGEMVDFKFSVVKRRNLPDTKFTASFDSMGDNSFGKERTMLTYNSQVFSPGDQFSAQYLKSIGQDYLSFRYEAPAPDYLPLRMSVYLNGLEYQVKDSPPKQFQHGYATIAGLEFSTPKFLWLDGQMLNSVGYEYKRSTDYVNDILTYGKRIDSIHLKSVQAGYMAGRLNVLADLNIGELWYDHDGFLYPFDDKLIHAEKDFIKLNFEAQFEQPITRSSQLVLKARGQYADKNLDSLEKISITGINGVRAYNSDVGTGDEGVYGGVEYRKFFSVADLQLQASVFYDIGQVKAAKYQYYDAVNEGTFQGVGVGLTVRSGNFIFQTTYSENLGTTPLYTKDAKRLWSVATIAF